jgi:ligand-binding sensor domain-containing protein/signal transduction histidine kinase
LTSPRSVATGVSRRVFWLCVLLLAAGLTLRAERLPIKIYTTADGLAHNDVNRIVRDSQGFLWFCTADGLSRFDGYTFTNFGTDQGLPHPSVSDLLETKAGEYWVATSDGLARFDPKGTPGRRPVSGQTVTTPAPMFSDVVAADDENSRSRTITVLREGRDGAIWIGTKQGLYRLEHANGRRSLRPIEIQLPDEYPEQREIADVLEDASGSLWIATPSGLYRRWPDGTAARYTTRDGLPHDFVQDLLQDRAGQLWAGTPLAGFFRFSADASHSPPVINLRFAHNEQDPDGLTTSWVFQLFESSDRRLWLATAKGLLEFFPDGAAQGRRFRQYSEKNGLSHFDITALTEDLGGNLWMGTNTAGAMKLTRGGFSTYGDTDGIETVNAIFEDRTERICFRGNVLGDTRTGVFEGALLDLPGSQQTTFRTRLGCFDGQRFDWFKPRAVSEFAWVTEQVTLQSRSGEWWVGSTREGLFRFAAADSLVALKTARPLAIYTHKDGLAALQVFRLFEDSRGNIWVSTIHTRANGLARWEPDIGKFRDLAHANGLPSLKDDLPRSFGEDPSGAIWIGFNGGLARHRDGRFQFFTAREGLPPGAIMNIHVDRSGRIWLASARGGLVRVDDAGAERPTFVSYTTARGLSSNNTEVIAEDLHGRLYVGGGHGLDRLDPATGRVKHFTTADGLAPGLFRAAFRDRAGVLWFGMTSGLARLAPVLDTPPAPPPVLISAVRVGGVAQLVSSLGDRDMSLPDLRPDQNQLQIDYVGLAFGPGEVLRYQYRLHGADADWSAPTEQRTVTYASLSPGRYTFSVRAVNSDGIVSAPPAAMNFTLLRPVWQRGWFLALVALAAGLSAYSLHRYRVARLLEMANLRTRIATDLHDDIGANLTRIALLSEAAKQTRDSEDGPLSSIARIARESVGSMSDIVWAINPARDSLLDLTRRMRQHAEEVFTLRDIQLQFTAPGADASMRLGADIRRDLLLTFKEAVNNAARHARCSSVAIDLSVRGSRLVLFVVDDGVGFDPSVESDGQGMMSLKRRAHRLEGTLDITSSPGKGTTVTLSIPV